MSRNIISYETEELLNYKFNEVIYAKDIIVINKLENYKKAIDEEIEAIYKFNNKS